MIRKNDEHQSESFQPIAVSAPSTNPLLFKLRCLVDLQLGTIDKFLRPAMARLRGDVLDIGAGKSPWREYLPSSAKYHGIDIESAADFGMQSAGAEITYYDGKSMPYADAAFDAAICVEVLEHVENPESFLAEIARVLKDEAPLLLTVPWSARRHYIPHDYHRFTRERLKVLLETSGFAAVEIRERGNDIGVIANKLVVMTARLLKPRRLSHLFWSLPLALFGMAITCAFLIAAHVSEALDMGSKEDPLGYFVTAVRAGRHF